MFNNVLHRNRTTDERVVTERDADGDVVAERVTDTDSDGRVVNDEVHRTGTARRAGALDTAEQTGTFRIPVAERTVQERPVEPVTEPVTEPEVVERPRWAHSSVSAITGLVVGVVALGTTLTGLLAPLGVAVGIVGALVSLLGLLRAGKRGVTGHGGLHRPGHLDGRHRPGRAGHAGRAVLAEQQHQRGQPAAQLAERHVPLDAGLVTGDRPAPVLRGARRSMTGCTDIPRACGRSPGDDRGPGGRTPRAGRPVTGRPALIDDIYPST